MALVGEMQYLQIGDNTYQIKDKALEQVAATPSSYSYWRSLLVGASSGSAEGFTPTSVTDKSYTFPTVTVQPSTGTIRISNLALVNSTYKTTLSPTTLTANRTITLPNASGTLALTSDIPSAATATPVVDGTAEVGSSSKYAKEDHVHPTDTSRAATTTVATQASINSSGLITYENSSGTSLFTLQLPLYNGGVS